MLGGHLFTIMTRQGTTVKYKSKKEHLFVYKVLFMIVTILTYLLGKNIPLYMIDVAAYRDNLVSAEDVLMHAIQGDRYQYSMFALGISPFMISGIVTQLMLALKGSKARSGVSPKKVNRLTITLTFILAVFMAIMRVTDLHFTENDMPLFAIQAVACVEMVTGAMLIIWLAQRNKKYGIGGQSALILLNLTDNFVTNVKGQNSNQMFLAIMLTVMSVIVVLIFENTEKRIPLQRVSIHNIYADKNYMAIKMNPIGVMPAMFAMALFSLMQLLVELAGLIFKDNPTYVWCIEHMVLDNYLGITVYILGLYVLTMGFSRVFLNPRETMEQFLKNGDSIQNIHAGRDTKRYLSKTINGLSFLSATMMAICLAVPLVLQMHGYLGGTLAALPSSAMMLVGISCNMIREMIAVRHLEGYNPFI